MADVPLYNDFEGGSHGTTITTGNSGGSSGIAFDIVNIGTTGFVAFDNSLRAQGAFSMRCGTGGTNSLNYVKWVGAAVSDFYCRFYLRRTMAFAADDILFDGGIEAGGTDAATIGSDASNRITLRDSTLSIAATSVSSMAVDAWHRIEGHVVCSTTVGQITCRIFLPNNVEGTQPDEELATAANLNTGAAIDAWLFGMIPFNFHTNTAIFMDGIAVSSVAWIGPAGANPYRTRPMPKGV